MRRGERCQEDGQALLLVLLLMGTLMGAVWIGGQLAAGLQASARAQNAADAAALAAVGGDDRAAEQVARANRAEVVRIDRTGEVVRVEVRVDGHRATAGASP